MEPALFLVDLADKLRAIERRNLATQQEIEAATGVDQSTVSRVLNRRRKRVTEPIRKLMAYADMRLSKEDLPTEVRDAAREFLSHGGTEAELIASIKHSAKLISRKFK